MTPNVDRLSQITNLLARVRTLLDGGWHYSSPLVRGSHAEHYGNQPLVERPNALDVLESVAQDLDHLSQELATANDTANELKLDTMVLCQANLELLATIYMNLSIELYSALAKARESLAETKPKVERPRKPRAPKSVPPTEAEAEQGGLFEAEASTPATDKATP
jgi:hypothetical protein